MGAVESADMNGGKQALTPRIVRFGAFEADLDSGEVRSEGRPVKLQGKPFRLLAFLLERPGTVVTREELHAALWPNGTFVDFEYGVNTAIKKIRVALGDPADNPQFIQTVPRRGYRFIAPVTPAATPPMEGNSALPAEPFPPRRMVESVADAEDDEPLQPGFLLDEYRIEERIAAGALAEVYRATDMRLHRTVALKVLPSLYAQDPKWLLHFQREARVLAALNHPHIATLYDVGEYEGLPYLVMEFVEGVPLEGPRPLKDVVRRGIQIADALAAAHAARIVHQDLKPHNVLVTTKGLIKVLDFGLAKLIGQAEEAATTMNGAVSGTPGYISPEQSQHKAADSRSDIFAFGCILYELASGRRAFPAEGAAAMAATASLEPEPLKGVPQEFEKLIRRCLRKDPERRIQHMGDVRIALEEIRDESETYGPAPVGDAKLRPAALVRAVRAWQGVAGLCLMLAAAMAFLWQRYAAPEARAMEFEVVAPLNSAFRNYQRAGAVSPDGRWIVFRAQTSGAPAATLWLRPLDSPVARPLAGTDGGDTPFWSPDSKSLAFYATAKLRRIDIAGGPPVTLCDALGEYGGSWSSQDVILFASGRNLIRIPASGGTPVIVTETDPSRNESRHLFPQFLPDGKHFLFLIKSSDPNTRGVYVGSLDRPRERRRLVASSYKGIYTAPHDGHPGRLLFLRHLTLMAQTFDAGSLRLIGDAVAIVENVGVNRHDNAAFWASDAGILAYRAGSNNSRLVWMSREGKRLEEVEPGDRYDALALSPDDQRVALCRADANNDSDIWIYEFGRKAMTRLTHGSGPVDSPIWSPDGRQIAFSSGRTGTFQIYRMNVDGSGSEEKLTDGPDEKYPSGWSRDGKYLLYLDGAQVREISNRPKASDVWLLPLEGGRKAIPLLQAPFDEELATFSPDGKWIAYMSTESGAWDVYVRAFSGPSLGPGGKVPISTDGGWPRWRGEGKEVFYHRFINHPAIMAARVRVGNGGIKAEAPVELFSFGGNASVTAHTWDVTADGQRLLISELIGLSSVANRLNVVVNWQARLKK